MIEGTADAVIFINPSEKRKKLFDFSDDLLESEFSIFIKYDREDIHGHSNLRGLKVGLLNKGLCFNLLSQDPLINLVTYPEILPAFISLSKRGLDAVVMDRQVGTFLLAESNIRGIRIAGEPVARSGAAISVRKGNADLLAEINQAISEIRQNGTYADILAKWEPKEVIFQTREQSRRQKKILLAICVFAGTAFAIILLIFVWNRSLRQKVDERTSEIMLSNKSSDTEITRRKKMEDDLRASRDYLTNLTDSMGDAVFMIKVPERKIEWVNDSFKILGYEPKECIGRSTEFLYPIGKIF